MLTLGFKLVYETNDQKILLKRNKNLKKLNDLLTNKEYC